MNTGVNWGYTGAKMAENMDPATLAALAAVLLLIVFTGYLIIYNVFQISVTNDIRFYGLLKTIGTTGRQIKALLRQQALLLSCIGIPIGLVLGWMVGGLLAPMVIQRLDGRSEYRVRASPDLCGLGPVCPVHRAAVLRQARPAGGEGLPH